MAFTVRTEDPSVREVGDLIIVGDRMEYVRVLELLDQNFVDRTDGDAESAHAETEDDDTESEHS